MLMTGRYEQDGGPLVVDLRDTRIETFDDLWDTLQLEFGLPEWFGRSFDAWSDSLNGGISARIDSHPLVIIKLSPRGLFAPGRWEGEVFVDISRESGVEVDMADG